MERGPEMKVEVEEEEKGKVEEEDYFSFRAAIRHPVFSPPK